MLTPLEIAIQVFGALGAIMTICLGIPQLIRLKKTKNTGKINFAAFWVFYYGILAWLILGVFTSSENSWYIFLANFTCVSIMSFTMFYLYYYYQEKTKKQMLRAIIGIAFNQIISFTFLSLFFVTVYQKIKFGAFYPKNSIIPTLPANVQLIIGLICPSFTTLAFLPGLIISIVKKQLSGLSPWMALTYMFNNTWWIFYFALNIVNAQRPDANEATKESMRGFIGGLVWQLIAISVYTFQFAYTYYVDQKQKKLLKSVETLLNKDSTLDKK
ncbi:PQ-loop domain-containing transporter [Metamycoplasma buccale]|uniref:PQ-loop domain-containing transporter n=1 Tax=Metamycoplasma buccale TaxID=55602 RepID=UPI00398EA48A